MPPTSSSASEFRAHSQESLLLAIENERRIVKSLEAHLALTRKRKQPKSYNRIRTKKEKSDAAVEIPNLLTEYRGNSDPELKSSGTNEEFVNQPTSSPFDSTNSLLDFLDIISSQSTEASSNALNLERCWQDDAVAHRMMPFLGGVYFTDVSQTMTKARTLDSFTKLKRTDLRTEEEERVTTRYYELHGAVLPEIGNLSFRIGISIVPLQLGEFGEEKHAEATVEKLNVSFDRIDYSPKVSAGKETATPTGIATGSVSESEVKRLRSKHVSSETSREDFYSRWEANIASFPKEELKELSELALKSRNLPQLVRDIVTFAEFDSIRASAYSEFQRMYGKEHFKILTACKFGITRGYKKEFNGNNAVFSIIIHWRWCFSALGRGKEELAFNNIKIPKNVPPPLDARLQNLLEVFDDQGVDDLVSCVGSGRKAIIVLLKALHDST